MKAAGSVLNNRSRSEYWRGLIEEQVGSGQSVPAFCAARGLTEQSFYSWRKRLNTSAAVSFALVKTEADAASAVTEIVLEIGAHRKLHIPRGVDAATLRTVLTVLGEQA